MNPKSAQVLFLTTGPCLVLWKYSLGRENSYG